MKDEIVTIIGLIAIGLITVVGITLLFSYPTMILWNWLMPPIFGLQTITFWQALGLMVLSTLLFWRGGGSK